MMAKFNFLDISEYLLFIFAFTVLWKICEKLWKNRRLPPGPWGLPFVGYYPFIREPSVDFNKLAKKYGPIFSLSLGGQLALVLNDYESMSTVFRMKDSNGRPDGAFYMSPNVQSFADMSGNEWKEHRRFLAVEMKKYNKGEGFTNRLENKLKEQSKLLISRFTSMSNQPACNIFLALGPITKNITTDFVYGQDFDHEIVSEEEFDEYESILLGQATTASLVLCFPMLIFVLRKCLPSFQKLKLVGKRVERMMNNQIEQSESYILNGNTPINYMDNYLTYLKKTGDSRYSRDNLNGNSQINIIGGSNAVQMALMYLILCLADNQTAQEKIYQELISVFGTDRPPCFKDKHLLPYTMAAIYESLRFKTIIPINSPHRTLSDLYITSKNYWVPKGTVILANTLAINNDPDYFKEPSKFCPEHYLDENGQLRSDKRVTTFSLGKRTCPGKELTIVELFHFTLVIVQKFKILPPENRLLEEGKKGTLLIGPSSAFIRIQSRFTK